MTLCDSIKLYNYLVIQVMKQKIGELNEVNTVATYFIPTAQLIQ